MFGRRPDGRRVKGIDPIIRITPYIMPMRKKLAAAMNLPLTAVSVKATTTEGLGFTGRGEGIAAQAIAGIEGKAPIPRQL